MRPLLTFAAVLLFACTESGIEPLPSKEKLDEDFTLRFGERALIEETNLLIRFTDVGEDSRCPIDVMCFWAGNAAIHLEISGLDSTINTVLNSTLEPRSVFVAGNEIALRNVEPPRISTKQIEKKDYVVTLRVTLAVR